MTEYPFLSRAVGAALLLAAVAISAEEEEKEEEEEEAAKLAGAAISKSNCDRISSVSIAASVSVGSTTDPGAARPYAPHREGREGKK